MTTPGSPLFVVQLHQARTLHYDFRLQVDGGLKSWAVPKGVSTDPRQRRLAIPTEDHPLAYGRFEGVIPPGRPGAGIVMLWDFGTYDLQGGGRAEFAAVAAALARGHLAVELYGRRLRGGYLLTRFRKHGSAGWLLTKLADQFANRDLDLYANEPTSAFSGRTLAEIAAAAGSGGR